MKDTPRQIRVGRKLFVEGIDFVLTPEGFCVKPYRNAPSLPQGARLAIERMVKATAVPVK
jgi:hypothetical protein